MLIAYTKTLFLFRNTRVTSFPETTGDPFFRVPIIFLLLDIDRGGRLFDPPQDRCPDSPRFLRLKKSPNQRLCDQLNDTTSLLDLLLGITAEVAGTDDEGDLGETALAEDLGVAEGQEVDDGGGVGLLAAQVGVTLLGRDESPEL